jgi:hypothetical protein
VMLSFYLGYKRGIAALKIHRSLLKNIFEQILPRRSCGFTAPSPTSNAIARHACMNRLMMPTSARLTSFSESRGGSSGTSPAVPKRNPSRSDLSRWHDRGCYRTESRRRLDCSDRRSRSEPRLCERLRHRLTPCFNRGGGNVSNRLFEHQQRCHQRGRKLPRRVVNGKATFPWLKPLGSTPAEPQRCGSSVS